MRGEEREGRPLWNRSRRKKAAARKLSQIIEKHTGVAVAPAVVANLIIEQWRHVSPLAHIIHGTPAE